MKNSLNIIFTIIILLLIFTGIFSLVENLSEKIIKDYSYKKEFIEYFNELKIGDIFDKEKFSKLNISYINEWTTTYTFTYNKINYYIVISNKTMKIKELKRKSN